MTAAQNLNSLIGEQSPARRGNKTFSPLLLAGLIMRPLPRAPLNRFLGLLADRIQHNHPAVLQRLSPLKGKEFLIRPVDLPHAVRLFFTGHSVECCLEDEFKAPADVIISGPLLSLLDMMDGRVDGDALFFSRELSVEGDTEALLTLRNAMDSDDIQIGAEILAALGHFQAPAAALSHIGGKLFHRLSQDMNIIGQALVKPLANRCDALEQENNSLRSKLSLLDKKLSKTQARLQSMSRKNTI